MLFVNRIGILLSKKKVKMYQLSVKPGSPRKRIKTHWLIKVKHISYWYRSVLSSKPNIRNIGPDISTHSLIICYMSLGHKWKQGMWSKEEIDLLMSNIERYLKVSMHYRCITFAGGAIFDLHPHYSSVCASRLRTEVFGTLPRSSLRCRKRSERIFTAV